MSKIDTTSVHTVIANLQEVIRELVPKKFQIIDYKLLQGHSSLRLQFTIEDATNTFVDDTPDYQKELKIYNTYFTVTDIWRYFQLFNKVFQPTSFDICADNKANPVTHKVKYRFNNQTTYTNHCVNYVLKYPRHKFGEVYQVDGFDPKNEYTCKNYNSKYNYFNIANNYTDDPIPTVGYNNATFALTFNALTVNMDELIRILNVCWVKQEFTIGAAD